MSIGPSQFGVFLAPFHALDEDPTAALDRDFDLICLLDRLGYSEVWVGEHHSGGFEIIAAPELFVAAAAERTSHIRLGTGVKSVPLHHPFMLADAMVQLDHQTKGRVMFGVGPGALPADAHQMGIVPGDQRRMMNEALDVLIPLLEGKTVSRETDWFTLREARLQLPCYTRPRMEMAVTTVRSPSGVQAAGRHGLGVLVLGGVSDEALAHHAKNWGIYETVARENGHQPDRGVWRVTVFMHLAETREQARADLAFGFLPWTDYALDVLPAGPFKRETPRAERLDWAIDNQMCIIGTPDDAVAEIERVSKGLGGFGKLLILAHNWAPWPATQKSYELFARYVAPHFTAAREQRQASYAFSTDNHEQFAGAYNKAVDVSKAAWDARQAKQDKKAAE